jgi:hypothetical protein
VRPPVRPDCGLDAGPATESVARCIGNRDSYGEHRPPREAVLASSKGRASSSTLQAVSRKIKSLATACALVSAAAGCSVSVGSTSGDSGSCAAEMHFQGSLYLGAGWARANKVVEIPRSHLHRLGNGTVPPCHESGQSSRTAQLIGVARISGVEPAIALAVLPEGFIYLRRGAALPNVLKSARWINWVTP